MDRRSWGDLDGEAHFLEFQGISLLKCGESDSGIEVAYFWGQIQVFGCGTFRYSCRLVAGKIIYKWGIIGKKKKSIFLNMDPLEFLVYHIHTYTHIECHVHSTYMMFNFKLLKEYLQQSMVKMGFHHLKSWIFMATNISRG